MKKFLLLLILIATTMGISFAKTRSGTSRPNLTLQTMMQLFKNDKLRLTAKMIAGPNADTEGYQLRTYPTAICFHSDVKRSTDLIGSTPGILEYNTKDLGIFFRSVPIATGQAYAENLYDFSTIVDGVVYRFFRQKDRAVYPGRMTDDQRRQVDEALRELCNGKHDTLRYGIQFTVFDNNAEESVNSVPVSFDRLREKGAFRDRWDTSRDIAFDVFAGLFRSNLLRSAPDPFKTASLRPFR
ncbi:MAG TPA: hypothetical protein VI895_12735 [Bdellovibrionota bacterium]|nr:hypothetical protein [Bdellovibrionota bacterium]